MRWMFCVVCLLCVAGAGCRHLQLKFFDDNAERDNLERQRREIQQLIDQNDPVGSRWSSHPDTMRLLDERNRIDIRLAEIDSASRNH